MKKLKIIVLILLVICIGWLYQLGILDVERITEMIEESPQWAPVVFILLYIIATIAFFPATPLSLAAGALFGAFFGSIYILIGATIGASLAFLVSRFLLQESVVHIVERRIPRLEHYAQAMETNGFLTVLLFRLVPLFPFNILNFGLGITKVPFREYVAATMLGMIPGTLTLSFLGGAFLSGSVRDMVIGGVMYTGLASIGVIYNRYKKQSV